MPNHLLLCRLAPNFRWVSPVRLVSQLMVLLFRLYIRCSLIVTDFDFSFLVLCPEQQEMVSMEQIIAIQKRKEATQKAAAQKAVA